MNKEEKKDFIVDDVVLKYLYSKKGKFSIDDVEKEIQVLFQNCGIDYNAYSTVVYNALLFLLSNRFEFDKKDVKYFIYDGNNNKLSDEYRLELIKKKEKIDKNLNDKGVTRIR